MTDSNLVPQPHSGNPFPEIRGNVIRVDDDGRVSLNDIWQAAGAPQSREPSEWRRLASTKEVLKTLIAENLGNDNSRSDSVLYVQRGGRSPSTWAHPNLAVQYAGYLSPELRIEIHSVFLRFKLADPTLADEVLQRATDAGNEWAAKRAISRVKRNEFTSTLARHGVHGRGYADCTNANYRGVYGRDAAELRQERGLPAKANLRDNFDTDELAVQTVLEISARKRIEATDAQGNAECERSCFRTASNLRDFLDKEEQDIRVSLEDRRR